MRHAAFVVSVLALASCAAPLRPAPSLAGGTALAEALGLARPALLAADGPTPWLRLGAEGPRLVPWTGPPATARCESAPEASTPSAWWTFDDGTTPFAVRLTPDRAEAFAYDEARGCLVRWTLVDVAPPEPAPELTLELAIPCEGEEALVPEDASPSGEVDLLASAPGPERLTLTRDGLTVDDAAGVRVDDVALPTRWSCGAYGGGRTITLVAGRDESGALVRIEVEERAEDTAGNSSSRHRVEVHALTEDGLVPAGTEERSEQEDYSGTCASYGSGEERELSLSLSVPGGTLDVEAASSAREQHEDRCFGEPEDATVCSWLDTRETLSWAWIYTPDGGVARTVAGGDGERTTVERSEVDCRR